MLRDRECPNEAVYLGFVTQADGNIAMLYQKHFQDEKPYSDSGVYLLEMEQVSHSQLMCYWWSKLREGGKKGQTRKDKLIQVGLELLVLNLYLVSIGQDRKVISLPLLKQATAMAINKECALPVALISVLMPSVGEVR